jgi:hypothetical protein
MKGSSDIVSAFHCLKQAQHHFTSFKNEMSKGSEGVRLSSIYIKKIEWMYMDFQTNILFSKDVRDGIRQEWASDPFSIPAIQEKISLIKPDQRELIETIVDGFLAGEEISFIDQPTNN